MVVAAGGTGGHLFPGIAVAEHLLASYPESKVLFVGTDRMIDSAVLKDKGFERATLKSYGLKGKSLTQKVKALMQLPLSVISAITILRKFKPNVVLGVGGYVTGPILLAAKLMGIPTCIHEQNSVPGLANRVLGKIVDQIFISIPGSERYFAHAKTILTGNPVRQALLDNKAKAVPEKNDRKTLLVLGGSQGAHRINELMVEVVRNHQKEFQSTIHLIHQTGRHDESWVKQQYDELGVKAEVNAFYSDMASLYKQADLLISRAGATTLAEITVMKKASILIPFPFAADNHQEKNGQYLVAGKAAKMFRQADLTDEILGKKIMDLLADENTLQMMSEASSRLARRKATETIVQHCLELSMGTEA